MINEHQEQLNINHNIGDAANNMLKIVVTEVESQPCSSPYCDQIIAVEKAILRDGHCVECYNQLVRQEAWEAGAKPHKIGFYIFLALLIFYVCRLAYLMTTIFVFDAKPSIIPQLYIEPTIAIVVLMLGTHFSIINRKLLKKVEICTGSKVYVRKILKKTNRTRKTLRLLSIFNCETHISTNCPERAVQKLGRWHHVLLANFSCRQNLNSCLRCTC